MLSFTCCLCGNKQVIISSLALYCKTVTKLGSHQTSRIKGDDKNNTQDGHKHKNNTAHETTITMFCLKVT